MVTVRRENDSMGAIDVPADKLWGAQTQRSLEHFRISTEKMPVSLIHALALTKRCRSKGLTEDLGLLAEDKARAIMQAADEVLADKHRDEFPLAIWQTGSRHAKQYEHERGAGKPGQRIAGRRAGMERKYTPTMMSIKAKARTMSSRPQCTLPHCWRCVNL